MLSDSPENRHCNFVGEVEFITGGRREVHGSLTLFGRWGWVRRRKWIWRGFVPHFYFPPGSIPFSPISWPNLIIIFTESSSPQSNEQWCVIFGAKVSFYSLFPLTRVLHRNYLRSYLEYHASGFFLGGGTCPDELQGIWGQTVLWCSWNYRQLPLAEQANFRSPPFF